MDTNIIILKLYLPLLKEESLLEFLSLLNITFPPKNDFSN